MNRELRALRLACIRGERLLFDDLSFTLAAGEVLQVRGINGSGKSSLLRMLCGLLPAERGAVHWCGADILSERQPYLAELIYLGHLHGLKDDLGPAENLVCALALDRCPRSAGEIKTALARLGLGEHADTLVGRLSAGQKRRLALARFLLTQASLWIMDEPYAALDEAGKRLLCAMIAEHAGRGGLCIVATHEVLQLNGAQLKGLHL